MAYDLSDDLAGFFNPAEFGDELTAHVGGEVVPFNGILTDAHLADKLGTEVAVTLTKPCIICARADLPNVHQGDVIDLPGGVPVFVNDLYFKGDLLIIHYHDRY